jgi:hypothetical protein
VALIQSGKILTIDRPDGVVNSFGNKLFAARSDDMLHLLNDLRANQNVEDAYPFGEYHHVIMKHGGEHELDSFLKQNGRVYQLKEVKPDIEDCFIALMKN